MNLNELYTQIITENSRSKQNRHPVEGATHSLELSLIHISEPTRP